MSQMRLRSRHKDSARTYLPPAFAWPDEGGLGRATGSDFIVLIVVDRVAAADLPSAVFESETGSRILLPNTALMSQILPTNNGVQRMTTTRQSDTLNHMTAISSAPAASAAVWFNYQYNAANQRIGRTETDSSSWLYQYDALGQVIEGRKYWSDVASVAGQQFEYGFDDIGNRKVSRRGGDGNGWNLRESLYTANLLNQYCQ